MEGSREIGSGGKGDGGGIPMTLDRILTIEDVEAEVRDALKEDAPRLPGPEKGNGRGGDPEIAVEGPRERKTLFEAVTGDKIIPSSGFLRDFVEYFSEQTDAPQLFHLILAYATLAAVVGNRAYFTLAGDRLFPNLWVVIIGPSGSSRKSTSLNKSRGCVSAIDPKAILPADFTTEALIAI